MEWLEEGDDSLRRAKKLIGKLNDIFGYDVRECYIHRDKVHVNDDNISS